MTTEELHEQITTLWRGMNSKQDFLHLLNMANYGVYGEKANPFTLQQLNYHSHPTRNKNRYFSFRIPKKKKGEFRRIDSPNPTLKSMQRSLNYVLQVIYHPHSAAMGFVPKRSIVSNAQAHTGKTYVYNIDLENFFPTITSGRVFARLQAKPFSLNPTLASLVADMCCYKNNFGYVLPQGAPTSPTLTNIICEKLDIKLSRLASAYRLKYTRYADDITFSGMHHVFSDKGRFCQSLKHIIEDEEHFKMNKDKTRLCPCSIQQEVTGIKVNEKPNVSREYVKQIRTMIHNWEILGYEQAQNIFASNYERTNTKHHAKKGNHHIENIVAGKLLFLKMVKGEGDSTYKKLNSRFENLIKAKNGNISLESIEPILDTFEELDGLLQLMDSE